MAAFVGGILYFHKIKARDVALGCINIARLGIIDKYILFNIIFNVLIITCKILIK
jgi:hypothetical protein